MTTFSPREIVSELDRYIVGQNDAKRAVAIALRNRWRRQQLDGPMREEVLPKNILMIGPTGFGKTEISRRLARLAGAPFIKVEATKFTEVGYVGRDVEQIVRDLVEVGIGLVQGGAPQAGRGQGASRRRGARARRAGRATTASAGHARFLPQEAARQRARRQGDRDRDRRSGEPGHADVRDPRHAGRLDRRDQSRRHVRQGVRRPHQDAPHHGARSLRAAASPRNPTSCSTRTPSCRRPSRQVENNGIVFLDEIDKIAGARGPQRRRRVARRRAARPAAADRGHDGRDQVRAGEDRPHPVHRLRRVPRLEAVRPAAGAAGPPADPRRADRADRGGFPPHPDRDRGEPDQAVRSR